MSTLGTIPLVEVDTLASILEAASKRVHLALHQSSAVVMAGVVCVYLHRAQKTSNKLRACISRITVQNLEDRTLLRDAACNLGQSAQALDRARNDCERRAFDRIPIFGPRLLAQLEDLACSVEDMAETAALGANEAFAAAVAKELRRNLDEHARIA